MYFPLYIAKYIITLCYQNNSPITNDSLQKVLVKVGEKIPLAEASTFEDGIKMYPSVYYTFRSFRDGPIKEKYDIFLPEDIKDKVNAIIKEVMSNG